jgi:aminopeptidase N
MKTLHLPMRRKMRKQTSSDRNIRIFMLLLTALAAVTMCRPVHAADLINHDITVSLDPGKHSLSCEDKITLPGTFPREFIFALHEGLNPSSSDPGVQITRQGMRKEAVPLEIFSVALPPGATGFTIKYGGVIYHPLIPSRSQARGFDQTPGSIGDEGVYLASSSAWYPLAGTGFLTFSLTVTGPEGWDAVSQGGRTLHERKKTETRTRWDSPEPQEEIYLIASRFRQYEKQSGNLTAQVFLRKPGQDLADKYLDATIRYVDLYSGLIGPYPYKKFALVENFWETGFGMPSFTLLGPTVLRLPFIVNTSYPHEILHNWWGNSVYPVYEKGNWSEGLTAYLADHLLKEQQGQGAEYRLNTLQKYADYVLGGRDFALTQFTSRHSQASEAIGYGKSLMFFHMLRLQLGDAAFLAGLRNFYQSNKFQFASFPDLRKSFEIVSGKDLEAEFNQWVTKAGAPELRLEKVSVSDGPEGRQAAETGYVVRGRLKQVQKGAPYRMRVPVAVTREGSAQAVQTVVEMTRGEQEFEFTVPSRPLRIDIDPEFDVFRRLDRDEIPPAITQALGSKEMLVLLPSQSPKKLLAAYREFADAVAQSGPDAVTVKLDSEVKNLPRDRAVMILGWENRFGGTILPAWKEYGVVLTGDSVTIGQSGVAKENHAFVLTSRNPENRDSPVIFAAADSAEALPGLGRKLPHYHKYSYLVFEGNEPSNVAKGRWAVVNSPLTAFLKNQEGTASTVPMAKLAGRAPLASLPQAFSDLRMMDTIRFLSDQDMKGRQIGTPELDRAAVFIAGEFREAGLSPGGSNDSFFQTWQDRTRKMTMKNVIAVIPGKKQGLSGQSVVIGAHYDHLGKGSRTGRAGDRGAIHPGADDNASGVAVLLELARVLKDTLTPDRSIVFVAFTGEEEGMLGSTHYTANEKRYPAAKCIGMLNLDTVGRLGSNKLLVLGGSSAREWVHIFRGAAFVAGVEIDMVSQDLDSSDQASFQQAGVPAVQLFSGPHLDYHRPTDTLDKIDKAGLVKVAAVAKEVVEYLAQREEPLTLGVNAGEQTAAGPKTERRVSLGTIPDFAYSGKGMRLSGVVPGSPAESAGLKEGDVITEINSKEVTDLKAFSDILKTLRSGDAVSVIFMRDHKELNVKTGVKPR